MTTNNKTNLGDPLTERELEALVLMSRGNINKIIGKEMGISAHTVRVMSERIFRKLGVHDRAHAVAVGCHGGLVPAPDDAKPLPAPVPSPTSPVRTETKSAEIPSGLLDDVLGVLRNTTLVCPGTALGRRAASAMHDLSAYATAPIVPAQRNRDSRP